MNPKYLLKYFLLTALLSVSILSQKSENDYLLDYGKMWTFDNLPLDYWKETYNFKPDNEWIENARLAALQFGWGCSAAFVSEDGLILTNHHCGRDDMLKVQKEGEDLFKTGFYAPDPESERKIPGLYVDQLVLIEDVTERIISASENEDSDSAKIVAVYVEKQEIVSEYSEDTGLVCKIVELYNGGKYSLYGYRRYNDIRLVMVPEFQVASTGWDWDNFTYPRYELDFMFFRAYDEAGNPVKTNHFFKFSENGAGENEPVFTVGRPGNTDRLFSVAQLEFNRDYLYKYTFKYLSEIYDVYAELYKKYPERESELLNAVMRIGNSKKVYQGYLLGLHNKALMNKKREAESFIISTINNSPELREKYSGLWKSIDNVLNEYKGIVDKELALRQMRSGSPVYFKMAEAAISLIEQINLPENERDGQYKSDRINERISEIYDKNNDPELENLLLQANVNYLRYVLGDDDILNLLIKDENDNAENILKHSVFSNKQKMVDLLDNENSGSLVLEDPIVKFVMKRNEVYKKVREQSAEINNTLDVLNQKMGEALYAVFGDNLSPDATLTLRISDGMIKGYEYNGTIAPPFTTFYGMFNRYFSFGEETYPWGLPEKWQNHPKELNMETHLDFCSTNDIVGGNSGSSIINGEGEVIGLAHDGNMESISGNFIYYPLNNRAIAVDSRGLLEALKKVYKTDLLVKELLNSKR